MSEIEFTQEAAPKHECGIDPAVQSALVEVLALESFALFAHLGRSLRTVDEVIARLEYEAVRCVRAGDGFSACQRFDLAAAERERARELRAKAAALRVLVTALARATAKR